MAKRTDISAKAEMKFSGAYSDDEEEEQGGASDISAKAGMKFSGAYSDEKPKVSITLLIYQKYHFGQRTE